MKHVKILTLENNPDIKYYGIVLNCQDNNICITKSLWKDVKYFCTEWVSTRNPNIIKIKTFNKEWVNVRVLN